MIGSASQLPAELTTVFKGHHSYRKERLTDKLWFFRLEYLPDISFRRKLGCHFKEDNCQWWHFSFQVEIGVLEHVRSPLGVCWRVSPWEALTEAALSQDEFWRRRHSAGLWCGQGHGQVHGARPGQRPTCGRHAAPAWLLRSVRRARPQLSRSRGDAPPIPAASLRGGFLRRCHPNTCHNTRISEAEVTAPLLCDAAGVCRQLLLPPAVFGFGKGASFFLRRGDLC